MAAKSEQTREKILDAALRLFREKGFGETTMREIASEAGVASGLAYYYFPQKEDFVMAFYLRAQSEMRPRIDEAMLESKRLEPRLRGLIEAKLDYFTPSRKFLGALLAFSGDPNHRLSPFSDDTAAIRNGDIAQFQRALESSDVNVPADLKPALPGILWMYQMGLVLFWLYDTSEGQRRARLLLEKSLRMVVTLLKLASLPLMRPVRRSVLELVEIVAQPSTHSRM